MSDHNYTQLLIDIREELNTLNENILILHSTLESFRSPEGALKIKVLE